jgi:small GTP-binding protein
MTQEIMSTVEYLLDQLLSKCRSLFQQVYDITPSINLRKSTPSPSMINRRHHSVAKIIVIGDSGVGKTALLTRYFHNTFTEPGISNLSAEYSEKQCPTADGFLLLQFWDTAGQETFRSVMRRYYRNAIGAILVYDIFNVDSLTALDNWLKEVKTSANEHLFAIVIGNKLDLEDKTPQIAIRVSPEAVSEFANTHKMRTFKVSAKTGIGVSEAIDFLVNEVEKLVSSGKLIFPDPQMVLEENALSNETIVEQRKCDC